MPATNLGKLHEDPSSAGHAPLYEVEGLGVVRLLTLSHHIGVNHAPNPLY